MSDASSEVDDYSYNVYGQWFQVGQNIHPGWITGDFQDRRDERDFRYQYSENRWKRAPWSDPPRESAREWKSFSHDIDLKRIKRWYDLCRKTHGDYCNDRYSAALEQHFDKFHLVDVNQQCLVTLASSTPYVALSYVWGKNFRRKNPHYTMLSKNNVEALKKPGALSSGDSARLPATIRDAMKLVQELDMEYLWVDCLCIAQDADAQEIGPMLKAMACIYASAEFTIVAAGGKHADHGLPGLHRYSDTSHRTVDDDVEQGRSKTPAYRSLQSLWRKPQEVIKGGGYPERSEWSRRGWTFQESLFSRRLLIFNSLVTWICGRCFQSECCQDIDFFHDGSQTTTPSHADRPHLGIPMGLMSIVPRLPSLGRWGMIVENYSSRQLTYTTDISRAYAGAMEIMRPIFPSGILHGLPVFLFDIALLWQPTQGTRKRKRCKQPSWSWTGWEGGVDCLNSWYPHHGRIYVDEDESSDWTIAAPLQSVATYELPRNQKIFNGFYQFQAMRQDPDLPIPAGWERHRNDKEHFYTHPSTGGHENKYAYPLPAAGPGEPDLSKVNTNILSCTAEVVRAVFTAVPSIHNEYILARIRTSRPLHRMQCKASFVIPTASQPQLRPPNAKLLLVAISLADIGDHDRAYTWLLSRFVPPKNHDGNGTVPENPATSRSDQEARLTPESRAWLADLQSYYNVLWVETSHGIAYRKGLGMIKKQEWDALGAEVTKLKMG